MKRNILAGLLARFAGTASSTTAAPGEIISEDGFVDVELPVISRQFDKDGMVRLSAIGIVEGRRVGFGLDIDSQWKMQKPDDVPITIYWGSAVIRSLGEESDTFLSLLAEKYGGDQDTKRMVQNVSVTVAMLDGAPDTMSKKPFKMKIFFEQGGQDKYAEIFINVDLENKKLEFRDKDPEYHRGILASLRSSQ
jgi:hypothetical protein